MSFAVRMGLGLHGDNAYIHLIELSTGGSSIGHAGNVVSISVDGCTVVRSIACLTSPVSNASQHH